MKKYLWTAALVIACTAGEFSAGAFAADMPVKAPPVAAPFNWSGFYFGAHGGYGWGDNKFSDLVVSGTLEPSGGFGGVQIGYNSHFAPHWLIGGEFDFSAGDISDDLSKAGGNQRYKIDYFGTARTRFGYVQDRSLFYVTGGVAWMHDEARLFNGGPSTLSDQYSVGWVAGGGWEYMFDPRWSLKFEYLYASFDKTTDNAGGPVRKFDPSISLARVGINYRFGDMPAPAAYMPVKAAAPRSIWSGGYIGAHGGYGWANYHAIDGITPSQIWDLKPEASFGGFQSGANWLMSPNWLFGLETDASYGDLSDRGRSTPSHLLISTKIQTMGTIRARFGYVMDRTLLYVTGGGAYAREKSFMDVVGKASKENHFGWTLGGGVEYKLTPEWSAKLEYLYADLGKNTFNGPAVPFAFMRNTELTTNTVKFGINYSGPVIERFFGGR
jgi:outer membrane immunogenic protein